MVKSAVNLPLLVGGGIKTGAQAKEIVHAGADIIVASTALERSDPSSLRNKIQDIMEGIKEGAADRDIS
jgi:phosphoglycerol geranylgeranyltransferase